MSGRSARTIRNFILEFLPDLVLQDLKKSTFQHLTVDFITELSQNLPYGPRPREQKLLFLILTYSINRLKNEKNSMNTRVSVSQIKPIIFLKKMFFGQFPENSLVSMGKPRLWYLSKIMCRVWSFFANLIGFIWEIETLAFKSFFVFEMINGICKYQK